jgi:LPPG:FO 2-phospho-L-lactate transferase
MGTVVTLVGQVGAAKLADGLYRLRGKDLAVIVNTGDDYEHLGLSFSPDIDTVLYTLAGIANASAGWEPEGETRAVQAMLRMLGGADQPAIGDRSLATTLLRSEGLGTNRRLTEITSDFCRELGIGARVLPMCDERVRTNVITDEGAITFTEYFTELGCEPAVRGFQYAGAEAATISDEVREALLAPDLEAIIIGPANPYHAIRPILEVPGMREMLRKKGAPVIAVTPLVGGKALRGSAGKMMRDLGKEPSVRAVAGEYLRLIDGFVIDREDEIFAESVRSLGIAVRPTATVMRTANDRLSLAQTTLDFAAGIRATRSLEAE